MNASELRIGNYVFDNDTFSEIIGIEESRVSTSTGKYPYTMIDKIEPIPINEDLLLELGFDINETGFFTKGRFTYHPIYGWKILENWVKDWVNVIQIKYVHEIQNLHFVLCGEELVFSSTEP